MIGVLATWIPAIIVSHLTGGTDFSKFNIQLLSPVIRKWMPKKYIHTEMKIPKNSSDLKCNKMKLGSCEKLEMTKFISNNDEKL